MRPKDKPNFTNLQSHKVLIWVGTILIWWKTANVNTHTHDLSKSRNRTWATCASSYHCKVTFTHARSGRGRRRAENWLQHKPLLAFTHARSRSGGGAGAKSDPQQVGPTPNFPRPLRNRAPQTIFVLKKWQIHPPSAPRMYGHNRGSVTEMSKSARLRSATAPRICERSVKYLYHVKCCRRRGIFAFALHKIRTCTSFLVFFNDHSAPGVSKSKFQWKLFHDQFPRPMLINARRKNSIAVCSNEVDILDLYDLYYILHI